jgi:hypothetical protein
MAKSILLALFSLAVLLGCGSSSAFNSVNPSSVVHASTPGVFTSTVSVVNPPYGMVAGIFNHGTTPIYLDAVAASVGPAVNYNPPTDGYIGWGYGLSNAEEDECQPGNIFWDDSTRVASGLSLATTSADTQARIQMQPCTPHGLTYGVPLSGGAFNYTNIDAPNPDGIKRCWNEVCDLTVPRTIAPGTGVTVWISRYRLSDGAAFGVSGKATVTFNFHQ